jgi:hypothetical protein
MTPRCVPERPDFRSPAQELVWKALRGRLRDVDLLMANVRLTGEHGDWEVDLIVGMPDAGFAVIEVKGGRVWRADGSWWQRTPHGTRAIDLEEESRSGKDLVVRYLTGHQRWTLGPPRMAHVVALPDVTLGWEDLSPGLPRRWILDRSDLPDAAGRVHDLLSGRLERQPVEPPGVEGVALAAELLDGRADAPAEAARIVEVLGEHGEWRTEAQDGVLDGPRWVRRHEPVRPPGTGTPRRG